MTLSEQGGFNEPNSNLEPKSGIGRDVIPESDTSMSDLKEIFKLLPKFRGGRELTVSYDKTGYWFAGYPNRDGDYSCDLYATDRDIEGACLNLLSQTDKEDIHGTK